MGMDIHIAYGVDTKYGFKVFDKEADVPFMADGWRNRGFFGVLQDMADISGDEFPPEIKGNKYFYSDALKYYLVDFDGMDEELGKEMFFGYGAISLRNLVKYANNLADAQLDMQKHITTLEEFMEYKEINEDELQYLYNITDIIDEMIACVNRYSDLFEGWNLDKVYKNVKVIFCFDW